MWLKLILLCALSCSVSLAASIDVSGVLSGNRMAGVPLGRSLGDGELDVEGICAEPGMTCLNCTHAVTCVALPYGYLKVPLQVCSNGETCNALIGGCSKVSVPECDPAALKHKHACEQVGIFPDAFDCRKFHLCSPAEATPGGRPADHRAALCPRHFGYNPLNAQCSVKLAKGQCTEKPVPKCTSIGQSGPLAASPNHYYVCLQKRGILHPQVFICPHGWYFSRGFCSSMPQKEIIEKETEKNVEPTEVSTQYNTTHKSGGRKNSTESGSTVFVKEYKPSTTSRIEAFFSTEKPPTYEEDTFLADKFDLSNYEVIDDGIRHSDDYKTFSFETGVDFW